MVLFLTLLTASPAISKDQEDCDYFADIITPVLYGVLKDNHELTCYYKDKLGVMCRLKITSKYLRGIVKNAYIASELNPSWGDRETTAIKHLSVAYAETRLNAWGVFFNKWNKTWDTGIEQVNDCNMTDQWKTFCKRYGYNYKNKELLYNGLINMRYAAYLNEFFIKRDQATYIYDGKPHQHKVYQAMIDTIGNVER